MIGIVAKSPKKGYVKTRLAQTIGDENALLIYELMLENAAKIASASEMEYSFFIENNNPNHQWFENRGLPWTSCTGKTTDEQYDFALRYCTRKDEGILICADAPGISITNIKNARQLLAQNSAVVGPCIDGGWYLVGVPRIVPIFCNPEPSQTMDEALKTYFPTVTALEQLCDVDTIEDVNFLVKHGVPEPLCQKFRKLFE